MAEATLAQTKMNLIPRLKEHHPGNKTGTQTGVTTHLLENPSHAINFNEPKIHTTVNHITHPTATILNQC